MSATGRTLSAVLGEFTAAEFWHRVPHLVGCNARHWPREVVEGITKAQDRWIENLALDGAAAEVAAETAACVERDGKLWCVVVFHYSRVALSPAPGSGVVAPAPGMAHGGPGGSPVPLPSAGGGVPTTAAGRAPQACAECGG